MELEHFRIEELVDKKTYEKYGKSAIQFFNPTLIIAIEGVWEFFNGLKKCTVTVNDWLWGGTKQWRGLRTKQKAIEFGAPFSEHRYEEGHLVNAIDCDISYFPAPSARKIILSNKNNPLLINITRMEDGVQWLHLDCKPLTSNQNRIYLFKV